MKKFLSFIFLSSIWFTAFGQLGMTVLPDSTYIEQFDEFVAIKFTASDIGLHPMNQNLQFNYTSYNTGYTTTLSHSMNIKGLNNMPNLAVGVEEDVNKHLLINFVDVGLGFLPNAFNWNAGVGVGYFFYPDKKKHFEIRGYLNVFYENITYFLGSYTDTTLLGFVIDGANIGTYVKNVKYVNNLLCATPDIELLYRRNKLDFFVGVGYDLELLSKEKISFYRTSIPISEGLYNSTGPINRGAIMPANYIIKVGIVKEFGLY